MLGNQLDVPARHEPADPAGLRDEMSRPHDIRNGAAPCPAARCPVCETADIAGYRNNLSHCRRCDHIFQTDLHVSAVYNADYAHRYDLRPHQEMSALRWSFIQRSLHLPAGSRILDVGYGNGSFLKYAQRHGMHVFGIDVHGEDFGIPTIDYGSTEHFDLVCFFDSLEHFAAFDRLFLLRSRRVVISLPNRPETLLEAPEHWRHYKPGEHLHYFSHDSLDFLMRRLGLASRIAQGFPEDDLRGKLRIKSRSHDNIYTAIYCRENRL